MRRLLIAIVAVLSWTGALRADPAGQFDYYVLALSWSPNWCLGQDDAPQCAPDRDLGWSLHGLWPQHDRGWPQDCPAPASADPSRAESAGMADIMGSGGLAWYQWQKHGRCSGLTGPGYYALARQAYAQITRPPVLRQLQDPVRLPASVIEEAFLEVNPALSPAMLTVTCRDDRIQEVRICLTRDLAPRACGADIARDCPLTDAYLAPIP